MRTKGFLIFLMSFLVFSCGNQKKNNNSISNELTDQLYGYWIGTDSTYKQSDNSTEGTILYYGSIDKNKEGIYIQGEEKFKYRVVDTYDYNKKIVISIYFSKGRERIETLTFSNNYSRIKNNLITPDNYSIDTYYIKKDKE